MKTLIAHCRSCARCVTGDKLKARTAGLLWVLLVLGPTFMGENASASDPSHKSVGGKRPPIVEIVSPKEDEILQSQPVSISIKFNGPIDPASFRASLNKIEITQRFTVTTAGAQASVGTADGLRTVPKDGHKKNLAENTIKVSVRDGANKYPPREYKSEREFYFKTRLPCSQPPLPPPVPIGTEPLDEPGYISEATAILEGASPTTFVPAGAPLTFRLSCPTLEIGADSVHVFDNGMPVPFGSLTLTADSITLPAGIGSGRHLLHLVALDIFGAAIDEQVVLWAGSFNVPVLVLDETGAPVPGATVTAKLADDPNVTATLTTDAAGRGMFTNLPDRSYNILASAPGNRIASRPATVSDGLITLRLLGFKPVSTIDNNDFSQGTAGWDIGNAPVIIIPHVEGPLGVTPLKEIALSRQPRVAQPARLLLPATVIPATMHNFDLRLSTSGEGQQSISRTFAVEDGIKSVTARFRFVTSEVPGGYFGTKYNDFYNVSIRTLLGGGNIRQGNSMNGLGLAAFDGAGATAWFEAELPIAEGGDTVQVDISVANVADEFLDSDVIVDIVKKKKLTIRALTLFDIDSGSLSFLSASSHTYFGGNTRVHGTLAVEGPRDESLEELTVEVLEGGIVVARGTLTAGLASTLYRTFGTSEEIRLDAPQLLFNILGAGATNQTANGALTLRVKARSSSGETAEKDFRPVTKLVLFTGGSRYGGRDAGVGGDDWAKPTVAAFVNDAGLTWGDFSNMNGGPFAQHQSHQTGNSADGWFPGYNARNAATAAIIIGHLNTYGARIRAVYVTFAPGSAFANAIANITLNDGRPAASVILNAPSHTTHFHWEVAE